MTTRGDTRFDSQPLAACEMLPFELPLPDSLGSFVQRLIQHTANLLGKLPSGVIAAAGSLALWLSFVRVLRWRRYYAIHRKFKEKWNDGTGKLTPQESQEIMKLSVVYDMPFLVYYALSFGLFKTYAIPTISKLLAATKELKTKDLVSKRISDTVILCSTWSLCPITGFVDEAVAANNKGQPAEDPRANIAIARTNWLHSQYKISNGDFLYTLCLFILEPINWAERYGWRRLSPMEKEAYYVFWAEVGRKMDIQDIPESLDALIQWSEEYEQTYMVPAQSNHEVASYTVEELLNPAPKILRPFGERVVISLLDDTTRKAMMYEQQPQIISVLKDVTLAAIAFVQRYFLPPRVIGKWNVDVGPPRNLALGECPRLHPTRFGFRPWYKSESSTFIGRCCDKILVTLGWYSEMPGTHLKSSGYRIEELGPLKFEHAGHEYVMRHAAELMGCPVTGPWSLEGREPSSSNSHHA